MPTAALSRRSAPRKRSSAAHRSPSLLADYREYTSQPWASLLFILPLLILHEWGVKHFAALPGRVVEYRVTAFALLTRFFHSMGASGRYLPALAVVAILLCWHIARRDRWVINIPALASMFLESVLGALPLVGVYFLFSPTTPTFLPVGEWKLMCSLYLGAGIYEELVFRLAAFALLSFLLIDLLRLPRSVAIPTLVVLVASGFAAYHLLGTEQFPLPAFVFVALRGVYYGIIFLERGFGLTVGAHTAYDIIFLTLQQVSER